MSLILFILPLQVRSRPLEDEASNRRRRHDAVETGRAAASRFRWTEHGEGEDRVLEVLGD